MDIENDTVLFYIGTIAIVISLTMQIYLTVWKDNLPLAINLQIVTLAFIFLAIGLKQYLEYLQCR